MTTAIRPWCAVLQYPDKKRVIYGTITMPEKSRYHEIIAALRASALEHMPDGFEVIEPRSGSLFFYPTGHMPEPNS